MPEVSSTPSATTGQFSTAGTFVAACFSPDGTKIYAVSANQVTVIDSATGSAISSYTFGNQLGAIDVSPDGRYLAVVEEQPSGGVGTIYSIDLSNGNIDLFTLSDASALYDVAYLSNGDVVVSQQAAGPLWVVDLETGDTWQPFVDLPGSATLRVSADGTHILAQVRSITWPIYTFDMESGTGRLVQSDPYAGASFPPPDSRVGAVSPDGSLVVQGITLRVFDESLTSSFSLRDLHPYLADPAALAFSPSADALYVLDTFGQVVVLDTATWGVIGIYSVGDQVPHPAGDLSVGYGDLLHASEDGRFISVIGDDGIHIIDLTTADFQSTQGDDVIAGSGKLMGLDGDDILTAEGDVAFLWGGRGNDTYYVASEDHSVSELPGEGHDTVHSTVTFGLGGSSEDLILEGSADIDGYGTDEDNLLVGNEAANVLIGFGGADELRGGEGNDTLGGGAGHDVLNGGGGQDTVSYQETPNPLDGVIVSLALSGPQVIGDNDTDTFVSIENLRGSSGGDRLTGNDQANLIFGWYGDDDLYGAAGNDTLDGGVGIDRMYGGAGNDSYIVSDATDYAYEDVGQGVDEVFTATNHGLRDNVENLTLQGIGSIYGRGNDLANIIVGNSGANRLYGLAGDDRLYGELGNDQLEGGPGLDRMYGGVGNDVYRVSDTTDYTYEYAGEGIDKVYASISHGLRDNIERLELTGSANIYGEGNGLDNIVDGNAGRNRLYGLGGDDRLYGRDGNDRLDGGAGLDRMYGGLGNDNYVVSDSTDYAYEAAGEGVDAVYASITHALRANVERLYLTGSNAIDGYGNELANVVVGNSAGNHLRGLGGNDVIHGEAGNDIVNGEEGNDWLEGGAGQDRFYGGSGSDRFVFRDGDFAGATQAAADVIHDFSQAERDHVHLDAVDADTLLDGRQEFAFIGASAFTGTAGELRYEQIGGNTYVSGDTDGDGAANFTIRLEGLHSLGEGDFIF